MKVAPFSNHPHQCKNAIVTSSQILRPSMPLVITKYIGNFPLASLHMMFPMLSEVVSFNLQDQLMNPLQSLFLFTFFFFGLNRDPWSLSWGTEAFMDRATITVWFNSSLHHSLSSSTFAFLSLTFFLTLSCAFVPQLLLVEKDVMNREDNEDA